MADRWRCFSDPSILFARQCLPPFPAHLPPCLALKTHNCRKIITWTNKARLACGVILNITQTNVYTQIMPTPSLIVSPDPVGVGYSSGSTVDASDTVDIVPWAEPVPLIYLLFQAPSRLVRFMKVWASIILVCLGSRVVLYRYSMLIRSLTKEKELMGAISS